MRLVDKFGKLIKKSYNRIITSYTEEDLKYFTKRAYKNLTYFITTTGKHNVTTYLHYLIKDVSFLIPKAKSMGTINRKKVLK